MEEGKTLQLLSGRESGLPASHGGQGTLFQVQGNQISKADCDREKRNRGNQAREGQDAWVDKLLRASIMRR